jgi:quinoprotein glucose dehydrogenase
MNKSGAPAKARPVRKIKMTELNRRLAAGIVLLPLIGAVAQAQTSVGWQAYNGGIDGDHYSTLTQINRTNAHSLTKAWTFDTGETGGIETNPLIVGTTLFAFTPSEKVVALDAATGKLKWKFDSGTEGTQPSRGFTYWTDGTEKRLYAGIMNFLYCLDPETG